MSYINIHRAQARELYGNFIDQGRAEIRAKKHRERVRDIKTTLYEFRLYHGDTFTGLKTEMTRRVAHNKNMVLEAKFARLLSSRPGVRLQRWKLVRPDGTVAP